jgi:hypothetical protein
VASSTVMSPSGSGMTNAPDSDPAAASSSSPASAPGGGTTANSGTGNAADGASPAAGPRRARTRASTSGGRDALGPPWERGCGGPQDAGRVGDPAARGGDDAGDRRAGEQQDRGGEEHEAEQVGPHVADERRDERARLVAGQAGVEPQQPAAEEAQRARTDRPDRGQDRPQDDERPGDGERDRHGVGQVADEPGQLAGEAVADRPTVAPRYRMKPRKTASATSARPMRSRWRCSRTGPAEAPFPPALPLRRGAAGAGSGGRLGGRAGRLLLRGRHRAAFDGRAAPPARGRRASGWGRASCRGPGSSARGRRRPAGGPSPAGSRTGARRRRRRRPARRGRPRPSRTRRRRTPTRASGPG